MIDGEQDSIIWFRSFYDSIVLPCIKEFTDHEYGLEVNYSSAEELCNYMFENYTEFRDLCKRKYMLHPEKI